MLKKWEYTMGIFEKINFKITKENIYIGEIRECTSYYSRADEAYKNGATEFDGFDEIRITSEPVKETLLVKLNCKYFNFYVELDNYNLRELKKRIKVNKDGSTIDFYSDELILLEEPKKVGKKFVNKDSIKRIEKEKIKTFIKGQKKENKK